MSGIGVNLNKIFEKNSVIANVVGYSYSAMSTIAPMILVIANIIIMGFVFDTSTIGYTSRELFACTILYIFIFALLTAAPFNAVLSRYVSDVIYDEKYENILPCFYVGLLLNILLSCLIGIPFCMWEYFVGQVALIYVFTGFCGYISLVLVFYTMLYLSICKDYSKISIFFMIGMFCAFGCACAAVFIFKLDIMYSMLLGLSIGFLIIACLEIALLKSYFKENSKKYKQVLKYFVIYWKLIFTNFLYTLGLYIHNFVFWTTDLRMRVADTFVCAEPYDLATCIAMFTNLSASVIFISSVEMGFRKCYKEYSEAVIGGRLSTINTTKKRMFIQLGTQLMNIARVQFIISIVMYLLVVVILPRYGFSGLVMQIYPSLAVGYFIMFIMYSAMIFLYYFNDLTGALMTSLGFCLGTFAGSIAATQLPQIWYGAGLIAGSFIGWCIAYYRIRWVERNLDVHIFCRGNILKNGIGKKPSSRVYIKEKIK